MSRRIWANSPLWDWFDEWWWVMTDDVFYFLTLANVGNSTFVAKRHHFSIKNTQEHPHHDIFQNSAVYMINIRSNNKSRGHIIRYGIVNRYGRLKWVSKSFCWFYHSWTWPLRRPKSAPIVNLRPYRPKDNIKSTNQCTIPFCWCNRKFSVAVLAHITTDGWE